MLINNRSKSIYTTELTQQKELTGIENKLIINKGEMKREG